MTDTQQLFNPDVFVYLTARDFSAAELSPKEKVYKMPMFPFYCFLNIFMAMVVVCLKSEGCCVRCHSTKTFSAQTVSGLVVRLFGMKAFV